MEYSNRFTVFIDLLGFRKIVEQTVDNKEFFDGIYNVLSSLKSDVVPMEAYVQINKEAVGKEELDKMMKDISLLIEAFRIDYPIAFTHFSDSLVISCEAANEDSCFVIFELLGRLNFRFWNEYKLVLRGGLTVGKLVHEENGLLFGPAMVKAYHLESKLAIYPRILIDKDVANKTQRGRLFEIMANLFAEAEDGMAEISLASSLNYLLQSIFAMHPAQHTKYLSVFEDSIAQLELIRDSNDDEKIKAKYSWLASKVKVAYDNLPPESKIKLRPPPAPME